jgi:hypothetical protein
MKQKATRIGLAVLVLLVWGAVIARAFQRPKASEVEMPVAVTLTEAMDRDTIVAMEPLHLAYDPFLDGSAGVRRTTTAPDNNTTSSDRTSKRSPAPTVVEAPRAWPKVIYHGIVSNADEDARRVGFLSIDGAHHMLKPGAEVAGLVVVEVRRDSAIVLRGTERRAFRKE